MANQLQYFCKDLWKDETFKKQMLRAEEFIKTKEFTVWYNVNDWCYYRILDFIYSKNGQQYEHWFSLSEKNRLATKLTQMFQEKFGSNYLRH